MFRKMIGGLLVLMALLAVSVAAELPRLTVNTDFDVPVGGTTHNVNAGGDLQAVINAAQPGDVILLEAGATFTGGPFTLPNKGTTSDWIYIMSSRYGELPAGERVSPDDVVKMATISSDVARREESPMVMAFGANHYRLVGLRFTSTINSYYYIYQDRFFSSDDAPNHITIDRSFFDGTELGPRHGALINGRHMAVVDSYFSGIYRGTDESMAIWIWDGQGPYKIHNNYLEATTENCLIGGKNPRVPDLVPSDIEFTGNYVHKPLSWRSGDVRVKNLFELKNAQRVHIKGNIFENNWAAQQNGSAILFTPRNQGEWDDDGNRIWDAPWTRVQDVTFEYNILRNTLAAFHITAEDGLAYSQVTSRITIENNLVYGVGDDWGYDGGSGSARSFRLPAKHRFGTGEITDFTLKHNTILHDYWTEEDWSCFLYLEYSGPYSPEEIIENGYAGVIDGWDFDANLMTHARGGIDGNSTSQGVESLDTYVKNADYGTNVFIGPDRSSDYPDEFDFTPDMDSVSFVDWENDNYRLAANSPYKGAADDGGDMGVDTDQLLVATAGTISGIWDDVPPQGTPLLVDAANGVLANDMDADQDALTAVLVTAPSHGIVALNTNGSFTYVSNDASFVGEDRFSYRANDGQADSNIAWVTITVVMENTAPLAVDDDYLSTRGLTE